MIDIKYPLNYTKNNGVTAVGIAAYKGNIKIMDMLYKAGADINQTSKHGAGPLYLAIKQNKIDFNIISPCGAGTFFLPSLINFYTLILFYLKPMYETQDCSSHYGSKWIGLCQGITG